MWTFGRTAGRLDALERQLNALERSLERLERLPKILQSEWEEELDRMNRVMGRLNARTRVKDAPEAEELPPDNTQPAPTRLGTHQRMQEARARHGLLPR